jgi:Na+:H+ antiporter
MGRLKPITVTLGATVIADILSLTVFAVCVSTYVSGFSVSGLGLQLLEIAIVLPLIVLGLGRLGAYALSKLEGDEDAHFGWSPASSRPPSIYLALSLVNAAVRGKSAKEKFEFSQTRSLSRSSSS